MVQTATHIFILTLEVSGASAPRIQNRQEGTMRLKTKKLKALLTWNHEGHEVALTRRGIH
jgi:hypothetical protein